MNSAYEASLESSGDRYWAERQYYFIINHFSRNQEMHTLITDKPIQYILQKCQDIYTKCINQWHIFEQNSNNKRKIRYYFDVTDDGDICLVKNKIKKKNQKNSSVIDNNAIDVKVVVDDEKRKNSFSSKRKSADDKNGVKLSVITDNNSPTSNKINNNTNINLNNITSSNANNNVSPSTLVSTANPLFEQHTSMMLKNTKIEEEAENEDEDEVNGGEELDLQMSPLFGFEASDVVDSPMSSVPVSPTDNRLQFSDQQQPHHQQQQSQPFTFEIDSPH